MNEYYEFKLKPLGYAYDALEPYIDEETMRLHHDKHYGGYVERLNAVIERYPRFKEYSLFDFVTHYYEFPINVQESIRNFGGGIYTHKLFFELMTPGGAKSPGKNTLEAIKSAFGSYTVFEKKFKEMANGKFGSGWVWLVVNRKGGFEIVLTSNADTPLVNDMYPVLLLDLWEHAYYLKYQNRRDEYVDAWFNVINWDKVEERYNMFIKQ